MNFVGFIDPPSPFASVEEWEAFVESIKDLEGPLADEERRDALRVIAEKKAELLRAAS